jgi:hypothetical protein
MEMSLGTFGDLRLDKRGARSSNRWLRARRCVCAGWVATVQANSELAVLCQREGDHAEDRRRLVGSDRCPVRRAACAGDR